MDKEILYRYTGNEDQLYEVRRITLEEGSGRGALLYQVSTAGGLDFDVTADCGLDVGRLRYRGVNMSYLTKNGYDTPGRFLPIRGNFDYVFPGGMLYTCGLLSVGPECVDEEGDGQFHPQHGRYHGQSASGCFGRLEGDSLVVGGTVRETAQGHHALRMTRRISAPIWGSELLIEDRLENLTPHDEDYMLLYHCNFGYPLLDENTVLHLPEQRRTIPNSDYAAAALEDQCRCTPPVDGEEERVYFNEIHGTPRALVTNPVLDVQVELTWSLDTLPILSQWKNLRSGDYVLALEPSTCYTGSRCAERRRGTLRQLRAFSSVDMWVRLKFSGTACGAGASSRGQ
ncbi:MAG: DUF4432 family protein [Fretibacterium sp.]|nr:DUF4432 family protein [Fretibacterium sp.]